MIVCLNCGKENQDHYKFCLGCGAKLPSPGTVEQVADLVTYMASERAAHITGTIITAMIMRAATIPTGTTPPSAPSA